MLVNVRSRLLNNSVPLIKNGTNKYTVPAVSNNETNAVEYPEILSLSVQSKIDRRRKEWHDEIKGIKTVEEKLFKINMPRYYGWRCLALSEHKIRYDSLEMIQYYTRTCVMSKSELPKYYDDIVQPERLDDLVQTIKPQIEDALVFEYHNRKRDHELTEDDLETEGKKEQIFANSFVRQVNRILLANLSSDTQHLLETQVDFNPRLESFWFAGGMNPPENIIKNKKRMFDEEDFINDPLDVPIRYVGDPLLHIRHNLPLKEYLPLSESENPSYVVPSFKLDPRTLGYIFDRKHATCIPGFWPGDRCEFGLLSYHHREFLNLRSKIYDDQDDVLAMQAMLASFAWLFAQACYQGFSTYHDVTYPLVSQMVTTDGQSWSFGAYQLNTTLMHGQNADKNPRCNFCWVTKSMPLFESIENAQVLGFNDEVLKTLIKFYMNKPEERIGVNMKPYLGESEKLIADIEEDERREWLESHYKHLVSNRPRNRPLEEIPAWEKIYIPQKLSIPYYWKQKFYYRLREGFKRRLDDHLPPYIPRCLRDPRPSMKSKGRWAKTFYP